MDEKRAGEIRDVFIEYVKTNNKRLILKYPLKEIRDTYIHFCTYSEDADWCLAMRDWIENIDSRHKKCMQRLYWLRSYFIDKIFPILLTGAIMFAIGLRIKQIEILQLEKKYDSKIDQLNLKVGQVMNLKQDISQTVNLVTKTEKEIANIKEAISQGYKLKKKAVFHREHLGRLIKVYENPAGSGGSVVFFQLEDIPIPQSVSLSHNAGASAAATFASIQNIVCYRTIKNKSRFLEDDKKFYYIEYYPDPFPQEELVTVENMIYDGIPENILKAKFNKYKKEDN